MGITAEEINRLKKKWTKVNQRWSIYINELLHPKFLAKRHNVSSMFSSIFSRHLLLPVDVATGSHITMNHAHKGKAKPQLYNCKTIASTIITETFYKYERLMVFVHAKSRRSYKYKRKQKPFFEFIFFSTWEARISLLGISRLLQWRIYRGGGGQRDARASKFFQFHADVGRIWQNCVFTPLLEGSRPHLGKILDPSLCWFILMKFASDYDWVWSWDRVNNTIDT